MSENHPVSDWDPTDSAVVADYVGAFAELRSRCPVAWSDAWGGFWAVSSFDTVSQVCRDPKTFNNADQWSVPNLDLGVPWLPLQSDPPAHSRYRAVIAPYLVKSRVRTLEPALRSIAQKLIVPLASRGTFDGAADFTQPFAGQALCIALNLPVDFWSRLYDWNRNIIRAFRTADGELLGSVLADISTYVAQESEARRADPGDDLMSALLRTDFDGRPLSPQEMAGFYLLLMSAGHDTASNSLGHALVHLAEHPEHRARLRAEPELLPNAVEEIIRYYAPLLALGRRSTEDVEVGGRQVRKGDQVALLWGPASQDPERIADGSEFHLDRPLSKHLSFGLGTHYCVGAELGRLQLRIAIEEFLAAFDSFEVTGPTEKTSWPTNGYLKIPMTGRCVPSFSSASS